jgi:hypothetical protein
MVPHRCQLRGHVRGDIPRGNDLGEMREPIDAPETKQMEGAVALSRHGAMTQKRTFVKSANRIYAAA